MAEDRKTRRTPYREQARSVEMDDRIDLKDYDGLLQAHAVIAQGFCEGNLSPAQVETLLAITDSARKTRSDKTRYDKNPRTQETTPMARPGASAPEAPFG